MTAEAWKERISFVLYGEDSWRILSISEDENGRMELTIDVHGLSVQEARRKIRNVINISTEAFRLNVVHGYNHGTSIKDMLADKQISKRLEAQYCPQRNPGETVMRFVA